MQLTEIQIDKVNKVFPYIKDKMVIDFVNGLDTARRLNQNNHRVSQSFIKRNLQVISGKRQMAQDNINDHLIVGLEACQAYFNEISHHQQVHAHAIIKLNQTLNQTQNLLGEVANKVADLQEKINEINYQLNSRINRLEMSDRADKQVEHILSAWQAEQFIELSPMGQCFLVLDTLKWGDFGLFIQQLDEIERERQIDTLKNKVISVQKSLLNKNANDDFLKKEWLTPMQTKSNAEAMQSALQYQGDWSWQNPKNLAMAFTATQLPMLEQAEAQQYNDLVISMIDINRVSQRMINNVFAA